MEHIPEIGNGTFELLWNTKINKCYEEETKYRALQQRLQPKRDITNAASRTATVNRDISYLIYLSIIATS